MSIRLCESYDFCTGPKLAPYENGPGRVHAPGPLGSRCLGGQSSGNRKLVGGRKVA